MVYLYIVMGLIALCGFIVLGMSGYIGYKIVCIKSEKMTKWPSDYGLRFEEISFNEMEHEDSKETIHLSGWWIPAQKEGDLYPSRHTVIFSHGYHNVRTLEGIAVLELAKVLVNNGFHVLMYDFRHCGCSEGGITTGGYLERYDLLGAIDYAKKIKCSKNIMLIGWSMGAAVSLLVGATCREVRAVVADSSFTDLKEFLNGNISFYSKLPRIPFSLLTTWLLATFLHVKAEELKPIEAAKKLKNKHLFLIHAAEDPVIPSEQSRLIYEAVKDKNNVELWIPPIKGHTLSYKLQKEIYEEKVVSFFKRSAYPRRRNCIVSKVVIK